MPNIKELLKILEESKKNQENWSEKKEEPKKAPAKAQTKKKGDE